MAGFEPLLLAWYGTLIRNTPQLVSTLTLATTTTTIPLAIPTTSGFNRVQVFWRARAADSTTAEQLYLRLNGTSASDYLSEKTEGNNAGVTAALTGPSTDIQVGTVSGNTSTANYFSSGNFTVDGVGDLTNFATVVGTGTAFSSTSNGFVGAYGGIYLVNGAAISSLTLLTNGGAGFLAGSVFSVYGLV